MSKRKETMPPRGGKQTKPAPTELKDEQLNQAAGGEASKVEHSDLHVVKLVDKASPKIFE